MMSTMEAELAVAMRDARGGCPKAYRRLLDLLSQHLRVHIRHMLQRMGNRGAADLDDILQETLISIHNRLHTYDPSYPVTVWVNAIAKYKVIDSYRASRHRLKSVNLDDLGDVIADPIDYQPGTARDVARLLAGLPANLRRPIEDVKLMGLTISEAAESTGMSESAVKIGIHRGMKRLAATLGVAKRIQPAV
jgi:RNA polymerase sigma-70 factor (ECF subfamily)